MTIKTQIDDLTLIIPAKNEKESLPKVLSELQEYNIKTKIILEASDHKTIEAIKDFDCEIIYQKNKGYGDALILGLENVKTEYYCIFNADGSFNPIEIPGMYNTLKEENGDIIFASRY
jgi:glycosyltransferase involved in cell wall biosynthesis